MRRPFTRAEIPPIGEFLRQLLLDFRDQILVPLGQHVEPLGDDVVGLRVDLAERQIFELLAHFVHAHAAGERRIDVEGLLGDTAARCRRHVIEGAHVVQPVGELDQQHAHVVGNGEQQLAQVLGLLGLLGDQLELFELGQALH